MYVKNRDGIRVGETGFWKKLDHLKSMFHNPESSLLWELRCRTNRNTPVRVVFDGWLCGARI